MKNKMFYYATSDENSAAFEIDGEIINVYGYGEGNFKEVNLDKFREICCKLNCLCKNNIVIEDILIPSISKCC